MKNKLIDLNNHLFTQLERLNDEDLTSDQLEMEIKRTEAITETSEQIVKNAALALKAEEIKVTTLGANRTVPKMLENESDQGRS